MHIKERLAYMINSLDYHDSLAYERIVGHTDPCNSERLSILEFMEFVKTNKQDAEFVVTLEMDTENNFNVATMHVKCDFGWIGCYSNGSAFISLPSLDDLQQLYNFAETALK